MTTECRFCQIASHDIGAHIVYEDEIQIAFLDERPIRPGHTLIIPKQHFDYFYDVPGPVITRIMLFGQKLATVMKELYSAPRVAFAYIGGELPHAHAHVVPLREIGDV